MDIINGKPTGSVRISFGYMSTFEDAKSFVSFVENNFQHSTETNSDGVTISNFIGRKEDDVVPARRVEELEEKGVREGRWLAVGDDVTTVSNLTGNLWR